MSDGNDLANKLLGGNQAQYAACRQTAQTLVSERVAQKRSILSAWEWLDHAMRECPPTVKQEIALHSLLSCLDRDYHG